MYTVILQTSSMPEPASRSSVARLLSASSACSAASSGRRPRPAMKLPSSDAPVWPRTNSSVLLAAIIAPCQPTSWPNQSFISNVRRRCTGDPTTASALICTISSGSGRPATSRPVPTGNTSRRRLPIVSYTGLRCARSTSDVVSLVMSRSDPPAACNDAAMLSSAAWVCAAASPSAATEPSGCNALRPLRNTRELQRTAPAMGIELDGAASNGCRRGYGTAIVLIHRCQTLAPRRVACP